MQLRGPGDDVVDMDITLKVRIAYMHAVLPTVYLANTFGTYF